MLFLCKFTVSLQFYHFVVKIGGNAPHFSGRNFALLRLLNLEIPIRGKCCPFFWENVFPLRFLNLGAQIRGKCRRPFFWESSCVTLPCLKDEWNSVHLSGQFFVPFRFLNLRTSQHVPLHIWSFCLAWFQMHHCSAWRY